MQLQGTELLVWRSVSPQQAYFKQAEVLNAARTANPGTALRRLEGIPEAQQVPMKKCRRLRPEADLMEQLDSTVPFLPEHERVPCARDIIAAWNRAREFASSDVAQSMYG